MGRRNYFELGICPVDEESECPQVGNPDYPEKAKAMCYRYIKLLEKLFPLHEKYGVTFSVQANPHDFGTYFEVVVNYEEDTIGAEYASYIEDDLPATWDDEPHHYWDENRVLVGIIENYCDVNSLDFVPNYSGRGMFGRICVGIVCDNPNHVIAALGIQGAKTDNMGLQTIVYWPKIEKE